MAETDRHGAGPGWLHRFTDRILAQWGLIVILAAAVLAVIFGLGFVLAPARYNTPFYVFAFRLLSAGPRQVGVVHLIVGVAVLLVPRAVPVAALLTLNLIWAVVSIAAVFQPNVSATAFAYPTVFAAVLFLTISARGYGATRP